MEKSLHEYRSLYLSPERLLNFYKENPRGAAVIAVPPGLGKTHLIKNSLLPLREFFPRIHYAASQHRIINEMLPAIEALPYIYRRPKDPALCGPSKTLEWENLYRLNLSQMGRSLVCHNCHNQDACTWYEKDKDSDKFLTLQSQDYLFKELALISDQALTILDELKFFDLPIQRRADRRELEKYKRILLDFPALQNLIYLTD